MAKIAIGCGGSGAKCLESLVHLYAAGVKDDSKLYLFFVDRDHGNGNRSRSVRTAASYQNAKDNLGITEKSDIFGTVTEIKELDLSTLSHEARTLEEIFCQHPEPGLKKLLFSENQLAMDLTEGFYSNPSVGSSNVSLISLLTGDQEIINVTPSSRNLIRELARLQPSLKKAFIFSSAFGGTGVSCFPRLSKLLWGDNNGIQLGGCLLLPYFSTKDRPPSEKVGFDPNFALSKSRDSLLYFGDQSENLPFKNLYLVGDDPNNYKNEEKYAKGGRDQKNKAHYVELLAGLGATHFFSNDTRDNGLRCLYAGREDKDNLRWDDLPKVQIDANSSESNPGYKLGVFTTFAASFLGFFYPLFVTLNRDVASQFSWISKLENKDFNEVVSAFNDRSNWTDLANYLERFMKWLHEIHSSTKCNCKIVNPEVLEEFVKWWSRNKESLSNKQRINAFPNKLIKKIMRGTNCGEFPGYHKVWKILCDADHESSKKEEPVITNEKQSEEITGRFVLSLYKAVKKAFLDFNPTRERGAESQTEEDSDFPAFLPKLVRGNIAPPDSHGKWENIDVDDPLTAVAEELYVPRQNEVYHLSDDAFSSLPTPWARPLHFKQTLLKTEAEPGLEEQIKENDNANPVSVKIRNEWRGLLGAIFFKDWLNYTVEVGPGRPLENDGAILKKVLLLNKPPNWDRFITPIIVDGQVLGGVSPESLIFAAIDYTISKKIPWQEKSYLQDPLKYFHAKKQWSSVKALGKCIHSLLENLQNRGDDIDVNLQRIIRELRVWENEVNNSLTGVQVGSNPQTQDFNVGEVNIPVLLELDNTCPLRLAPRFYLDQQNPENEQDEIELPIIVYKEMNNNNEIPSIYGAHLLKYQDFPEEDEGTEISTYGIKEPWVKAESLFTDKLQEIKPGKVISQWWDHPYLIPLKSKILDYLCPEEILDSISLSKRGREIIITLKLPVEGQGDHNTIKVSKSYDKGNDVETYEDMGHVGWSMLEVWPDKQIKDWNEYWVFNQIGEVRKSNHRKWRFEPIAFGINNQENTDPQNSPLNSKSHNNNDRVFYKLTHFPLALKCIIERIGGKNDKKEVGLLFPDPTSDEEGELYPEGGSAKIAVDLGTSNTSVFYRINEGPPSRMIFKNRVRALIKPHKDNEPTRPDELKRFFFPGEEINLDFFPTQFSTKKANPTVPPVDGIVSFMSPFKDDHEILSEIKARDERSPHMKAYLTHLIKMIMVELLNKRISTFDLIWAYPAVLSHGRFNTVWDGIRDHLREGLPQDLQENVNHFGFTESVAGAHWLERSGAEEQTQVLIDTGGGTTDLSFLERYNIKLQNSFKLAGNLFAVLLGNKKFLETCWKQVNPNDDSDINQFKKSAKQQKERVLNFVLNKIKPGEIQNNPDLKPLLFGAWLLYPSIMYITGQYLGWFWVNEKGKNPIDPQSCSVTLAGNASGMVSWINPDLNKTKKMLKRFFLEGTCHYKNSDIAISISPEPKLVVARGLLNLVPGDKKVSDILPAVILSGEENYSHNGSKLDRFKAINDLENKKLTCPTSIQEMTCLKEILGLYDDKFPWTDDKDKKQFLDLIHNEDVLTDMIPRVITYTSEAEYNNLSYLSLEVEALIMAIFGKMSPINIK